MKALKYSPAVVWWTAEDADRTTQALWTELTKRHQQQRLPKSAHMLSAAANVSTITIHEHTLATADLCVCSLVADDGPASAAMSWCWLCQSVGTDHPAQVRRQYWGSRTGTCDRRSEQCHLERAECGRDAQLTHGECCALLTLNDF